MTPDTEPLLLVVDDDPEDGVLVATAVQRSKLPMRVQRLADGDALMQFLQAAEPRDLPRMVILLDLNMPGKDGRACLREIKADLRLADIPVLVFSTSDAPDDIQQSYALNANSYICKPDDLTHLERILTTLYRYWFDAARAAGPEAAS